MHALMHMHALLGGPFPLATEPLLSWTLHVQPQLKEGCALSASGIVQQHVLPHTCRLLQEQQSQRRCQQPSSACKMAVTFVAWPCHVSHLSQQQRQQQQQDDQPVRIRPPACCIAHAPCISTLKSMFLCLLTQWSTVCVLLVYVQPSLRRG